MSRASKAKPELTPGEVLSTSKVLVRTYSAGVHYGTLHKLEGTTAWLVDTRRIWRWRGANTLSELSQEGLEHSDKGHSRVSKEIALNVLTEAIEIIPCSDKATKSIDACGWAE